MATTCSKLIWLRYILADLQVSYPQTATLYYDNQATPNIAANLMFHECTKYIELYCHLMEDKIEEGSIQTTHIATSF